MALQHTCTFCIKVDKGKQDKTPKPLPPQTRNLNKSVTTKKTTMALLKYELL